MRESKFFLRLQWFFSVYNGSFSGPFLGPYWYNCRSFPKKLFGFWRVAASAGQNPSERKTGSVWGALGVPRERVRA